MNYKVKMFFECNCYEKLQRFVGNRASKKGIANWLVAEKLLSISKKVHDASFKTIGLLKGEGYYTNEPVTFENRQQGKKIELKEGLIWANNTFDCMWANFTADISGQDVNYNDIVFLLDLGGEGLVCNSLGEPKQAITCYATDYDYSLGKASKKIVINQGYIKDKKVNFWVDTAGNDLFGKFNNSAKIMDMKVALFHKEIFALSYDIEILANALIYADRQYAKSIKKAYGKLFAINCATLTNTTAQEYRQQITAVLQTKNTDKAFEYSAIGHAHLDLAWLWPIRETYRKGARTFSNQLLNIKLYDNYIFGASQAQLYAWIKEKYPTIYSQVKAQIVANRWEVQGATWVEMDSNLISGESLIRQFFYGKKYFYDEFKEDMQVLWLPDSFGYSPCLPQVMKLANTPYFLTQKMSWNTTTKFPYHTFNWQGLDGSEVFAHMLPESTYNSPCRADKMIFGVKNYQENSISDKSMMLFGIGDGGAGPGFEHIERAIRQKDVKPIPKVKMRKSVEFFEEIVKEKDKFNTYRGELYLEKHQGTYTTQVMNKWFNRKCEFLLKNYELLIAMLGANDVELPINLVELEAIWKEILLYQFHDILPGSSIKRVYEESIARYNIIYKKLQEATYTLLQHMGAGENLFNPNSYDYNYKFQADNKWLELKVPKFAVVKKENATVVSKFFAKSDSNSIETDLYKLTFKNGLIVSLIDKSLNKDFVRAGECMGQYSLYDDFGDCWDFKSNYRKTQKHMALSSFAINVDGASASATSKFELFGTIVEQKVCIIDGVKGINIETNIDFNSSVKTLRVSFATAVDSNKCAFNTQFGHIYRPTTENSPTEVAQIETSGQKFVDLSNGEYGISILNDCKYGYRNKFGVIDICLVRSPKGNPCENVDIGVKHKVAFTILPHSGQVGLDTYKYAYLLNNPIIHFKGIKENSLNDIAIDNENIVVESTKIAQNKDVIIRLYNASEHTQKCSITFNGSRPKYVVDIMENEISKADNEITLRSFELINLLF